MSFENSYREWHTKISYIKSAVRIIASGSALWFYSEPTLAVILLASGFAIAEVLGILEEWL